MDYGGGEGPPLLPLQPPTDDPLRFQSRPPTQQLIPQEIKKCLMIKIDLDAKMNEQNIRLITTKRMISVTIPVAYNRRQAKSLERPNFIGQAEGMCNHLARYYATTKESWSTKIYLHYLLWILHFHTY